MTDFELATAYDTVNVLRRGGAAKVELNRPETMNAWNRQFGVDLLAAIESVASDDDVRAVMITGAGRGFSSGADLKEMGTNDDVTPEGRPNVRKTLTERYHPIITTIRTMPKPVVAAVNGPAVGIGLSLALASDLIVARESAYFLLAFVNIGLVPDGGSSLFVPDARRAWRARPRWRCSASGSRRRRRSNGASSTASSPTTSSRQRPNSSSTAWPPGRPAPTRARSAS